MSLNKWLALIVILFVTAICSYKAVEASYVPDLGDWQTNYVSLKKGKIEYFEMGTGSPIVLISGYGVSVNGWNSEFLNQLAKNHRVIVFNNRHVGKSIVKGTSYTSQDLADDTYQLIQGLKLNKPAIVGYSMGGMIAQQLAVKYPDVISRLILINTAIAGSQAIHPDPSMRESFFNVSDNAGLNRFMTAVKFLTPPSHRIQLGIAILKEHFLPNYPEQYPLPQILKKQQNLIMHWTTDEETAQQISKLKIPVLILNGDQDQIVPSENGDVLAKILPEAKFLRIKSGGHAMIYQYPNVIASSITDFLQDDPAKKI